MDQDNLTALVEFIVAADLGLDEATARQVVVHVATQPNARARLRNSLTADPELLTAANPQAPQQLQRLMAALIAAGAARVRLPRCQRCSSTRPLEFSLPDGRRVCSSCRRSALAHPCGKCRQIRYCSHRLDGVSVCGPCYANDPRNFIECESCGRPGRRVARTATGVLCTRCARRPEHSCTRCQRSRPAAVILMRGPVCASCYMKLQRTSQACPRCREQKVLAYLDEHGVDVCARCADQPAKFGCEGCGSEQDLVGRCCARCVLTERVTRLLSDEHGTVCAELAPVLNFLRDTRNPRSSLRWLSRSPGTQILRSMSLGDLPVSHDGLNQLPVSRQREFVRNILITAGILEAQPAALHATLEWMDSFIAELPLPGQQVVRTYARWDAARHLRAKAAQGKLTWHGGQNTRARFRAIADFLAWLAERDLTLPDARQKHVDEYLAAAPSPIRYLPQFLRWAHETGHCQPLTAPSRRPELSTAQVSDDDRWQAVERLLHNEDIRVDTRVCGLFVLLYGQRLSHICQMTRTQVVTTDDAVTVRFATDPITMPPGADELVRHIIARTAATEGAGPSPAWLFPGRSPGQPLGPTGLGVRLRNTGVKVRAGRTAALIQLAGELPAPVLASLLGIHPQTAVIWSKIAARDWNQYTALRAAHRNSHE